MSLPPDALSDIIWWEDHVRGSFCPTVGNQFTSPCTLMQGLKDGEARLGDTCWGRWTEAEIPDHINVLELHAAYLTLQALGVPGTNVHIRLMLDNTTVTMYINKMGDTHSVVCNPVSKTMTMGHPQEDLVICSVCPWFTKPF